MTAFANIMEREATTTFTENGMKASDTTGSALVDLFGVIGALRNRNDIQISRAQRLFADAYAEDPLLATKTVFYGRDIRGGLGERDIPNAILRYAAKYHPEAVKRNISLMSEYGRFDDLYCLIGTPLEKDMWATMKSQFETDKANMEKGLPISLLAKWIKTPDASSKNTRRLGILTAKALGYSVYDFKRILRKMRKYLDVTEVKMSDRNWDAINYSAVPAKAMTKYRRAFLRNDTERFSEFTNKAVRGEVKINAGTLYPYDIVEKIFAGESSDVLEAQWRQFPEYIEGDENVLIMADVSGSMDGRPMATSIGLALYFAEHNKGSFHNLFMTFSEDPKICKVKGETLKQKIKSIEDAEWGMSTNIEAAFQKVLDLALDNRLNDDELPKAMIIITDMEFNDMQYYAEDKKANALFYDHMETLFAEHGYHLPKLVFWNVNSRHDVFHATSDVKGCLMVSGHSASTFKTVLDSLDMTAYEMMVHTLSSDRYAPITLDSDI